MSVSLTGVSKHTHLPPVYPSVIPHPMTGHELSYVPPMIPRQEQVPVISPLERQLQLFNSFCNTISFASAWESLFCIEFTDQSSPGNIKSFYKEVEALSAYLQTNPHASVPTIYKVVSQGRDRVQVLQKIHVYRLLLETMIL